MIVILLVVVPCVVVAVAGWGLASQAGAFKSFGAAGGPGSSGSGWRDTWRLGSDSEGVWPVRHLQRFPQPVLIGIVVVTSLWLLAWLIALAVGLSALSV